MEIIADHGRMLSFEIVEVNPVIDEHNRTADLAVELALSRLGRRFCRFGAPGRGAPSSIIIFNYHCCFGS